MQYAPLPHQKVSGDRPNWPWYTVTVQGFVTSADLLRVASDSGFAATPALLKRLRRQGLLPSVRQTHRVGEAGSTALYPAWAAEQLLAVLTIRSLKRSKPFSAVRLIAWEEGIRVDFRLLRADVAAVVREAVNIAKGTHNAKDPDDHLAARVSQLLTGSSWTTNGWARMSVAPADDLLTALVQIAAGSPDSDLALDTLDMALPNVFSRGDDADPASIADLYRSIDVLPPLRWPRVISRSGRRHFEVGRQGMFLVQNLARARIIELPEFDDSDDGISGRVMIAATFIVLMRTQPELMERLGEALSTA